LDPTSAFVMGWNPCADGPVLAIAVPPAGTSVYAGGAFTSIGGSPRSNLAALDTFSGAAMGGWDPSPDGVVEALAVSNVTVYAGGSFTTLGGQPRTYLGALDGPSGTVMGWNPSPDGPVRSLAVRGPAPVRIIAGGEFHWVGGQVRNHLAAIDALNGLPTSWDPDPDGVVHAVATDPLPNTGIMAGGEFRSSGRRPRANLAAFNRATGELRDWDPAPDGPVHALEFHGARLYAGGSFSTMAGIPKANLASFFEYPAAAIDSSWTRDPTGPVYDLHHWHGHVYIAGDFQWVKGQFFYANIPYLARVQDGSGELDTTFDPSPNGAVHTVLGLSENLGFDVKLYFAGAFTELKNPDPFDPPLARSRGAALSLNGNGAILPWDPSADGTIRDLMAWYNPPEFLNVTVYAGGDFSTIGGQPRAYVAELDATGAATAWDAAADGPVHALFRFGYDDVVYAGGLFDSIGGQDRLNLAGLSSLTGLANSWDPRPNGQVNVITAPLWQTQLDIYVGGEFTEIAGSPDHAGLAFFHGPEPPVDAPEVAAATVRPAVHAAPNPFRSQVDLSFSTGVPGIARLDVYDLAGRHVRALREGFAGPGEQRVVWDGRDDAGRSVATGVYFVRARGQGLDARARVLRLR
jgi:hypothetical protein